MRWYEAWDTETRKGVKAQIERKLLAIPLLKSLQIELSFEHLPKVVGEWALAETPPRTMSDLHLEDFGEILDFVDGELGEPLAEEFESQIITGLTEGFGRPELVIREPELTIHDAVKAESLARRFPAGSARKTVLCNHMNGTFVSSHPLGPNGMEVAPTAAISGQELVLISDFSARIAAQVSFEYRYEFGIAYFYSRVRYEFLKRQIAGVRILECQPVK